MSTPTGQTSRKSTMTIEESLDLRDCLVAIGEQRCKKSFAILFKRFAPKIKGIAMRKYNSEAFAMEVVQDTMTNVWRKAHLYTPDKGAATTWIYTVMRNVTFDLLRKSKAQYETSLGDDLWPLDEYAAQEEDVFNDHLLDKTLLSHIDKLPEKQKQVVQGVYFSELSQEQLAEQLGIPLGTVKSRLRLALEKLKQQLGEQHD
ncbi:RNA polymerase subunit sigma [Saccharobesus litoralis]|uniref:RNA polymerase subunit sigma n=1 Tax=Saccharobesus litoralis TaxID=2172099 RepID=A0A2S0VMF7_9ALTE|nr:sigma-70 family RNA polymerase sigma factor [Saccharobesus litoralis]AWB65403.1 RNA polymerase subunit sigma [Saccharobesus litoralis]